MKLSNPGDLETLQEGFVTQCNVQVGEPIG